ncbi:hypothetical protein ACSQ67_023514 [Phaseolus vulgaris]
MNWPMEGCFSLVHVVHLLKKQNDLMDLVDERWGKDFRKDEVVVMINVALLCTQVSPMHRPTMASVVCMLEGKTKVLEVVVDTSEILDGKKLEMQQYYRANLFGAVVRKWTWLMLIVMSPSFDEKIRLASSLFRAFQLSKKNSLTEQLCHLFLSNALGWVLGSPNSHDPFFLLLRGVDLFTRPLTISSSPLSLFLYAVCSLFKLLPYQFFYMASKGRIGVKDLSLCRLPLHTLPHGLALDLGFPSTGPTGCHGGLTK